MALPDPKKTAAQNMIKRSGPDASPFLQALLDVAGLFTGGAENAATEVAKKAVPAKKKEPEEEVVGEEMVEEEEIMQPLPYTSKAAKTR